MFYVRYTDDVSRQSCILWVYRYDIGIILAAKKLECLSCNVTGKRLDTNEEEERQNAIAFESSFSLEL